ncbi:MAG: hypothetical protein Q4F72_05945 [Desulfovibrionaceae bacterium]|nr:hypothetical protein [Desulfovibrionaceae bacterium]
MLGKLVRKLLGVPPAGSFHAGPPSEDGAAEAWLKSRGSDADREARALESRLAAPDTRAWARARLRELGDGGSAWAAWISGSMLAQEGPDQDPAAARVLLDRAAEAGIGAACALRADLCRPETDEERAALARRLLAGAQADWPGCALRLAGLWLSSRARLTADEAETVARTLLAAAKRGSWDALDLLLSVCLRKAAAPQFDLLTKYATTLLQYAVNDGFVPALLRLGVLCDTGALSVSGAWSAEQLLERAWNGGSAEAGCRLAELRMDRRDDPGPILELLQASLDRGCARAGALLAVVLYALDGPHGNHEAAVGLCLEACRAGEAEQAAETGWAMCRTSSEAGSAAGIACGMRVLEAALEADSDAARLYLARLALLGLDGGRRGADGALALLEEAKRRGDGRACGELASIFLLGLHGLAKDPERGVVAALAGLDLDNSRSMALLLLIRAGAVAGPPAAERIIADREAGRLADYLLRSGEPLFSTHALLSRIASPDGKRDDPAEDGRTLAQAFTLALQHREMAVIRLVADMAGKPAAGTGDAPGGWQRAVEAFSGEFGVRIADREGLAGLAAMAAERPGDALPRLRPGDGTDDDEDEDDEGDGMLAPIVLTGASASRAGTSDRKRGNDRRRAERRRARRRK